VRLGISELGHDGTTWIQINDKPFEYIVRAKWLPDGRRLSLETMPRLQTALHLYFADRKTGKTTHVLTETDPGWVNMHDDLYFFNDGQHFLALRTIRLHALIPLPYGWHTRQPRD
jgi:dipeptidyl-peptidase-4